MIRLDQDLIIFNADGEKIPVYIEGDAPPMETLPREYFTVSEDATTNEVVADNKVVAYLFEFTLKYYTADASTLYTRLIEAIDYLKSKNYDVDGIGYRNGTYNNIWYSRAVDVEKIENLEE